MTEPVSREQFVECLDMVKVGEDNDNSPEYQQLIDTFDALTAAREQDRQRIRELEEQVKVGDDLTGSFFEALKPLKLQSLDVMNPGRHVTELIEQLATAQARVEELEQEEKGLQACVEEAHCALSVKSERLEELRVYLIQAEQLLVDSGLDAYDHTGNAKGLHALIQELQARCAEVEQELSQAKQSWATWKRRFDDVHNALGCDDATVTEVITKAHTLTTALAEKEGTVAAMEARYQEVSELYKNQVGELVLARTALQQAKEWIDIVAGQEHGNPDAECSLCMGELQQSAARILAALAAGGDHLPDASTMVWSDAKPTVPGWYWWRDKGFQETCVKIEDRDGGLRYLNGMGWLLLADHTGGQWSSQPIPPPPDAGEGRR